MSNIESVFKYKGSSDNTMKMISIWLTFCIVIPGLIHQASSIKYPINYMTDYLDVGRDKSEDIFKLPLDTLQERLLNTFPRFENTFFASQMKMDKSIINRSLSGLVNILKKETSFEIEKSNYKKMNL